MFAQRLKLTIEAANVREQTRVRAGECSLQPAEFLRDRCFEEIEY
jgi:hypothetical protein